MPDRTAGRRFDPHHGIPNGLRNDPRLLELEDDDRARLLGYVSILHAIGNETSLCSLLPLKVATREVRLAVLHELAAVGVVRVTSSDVVLCHYDGSNLTRDERATRRGSDRERKSRSAPATDPDSTSPVEGTWPESPFLGRMPHSAPSLNGTNGTERNGTEHGDVQEESLLHVSGDRESPTDRVRGRPPRTNRFNELWSALLSERRSGRSESDFRRPCPAHDGDGATTLHVVVHGTSPHRIIKTTCFSTQCKFAQIAESLGFCEADGFESAPPTSWRPKVNSKRVPRSSPKTFTAEAMLEKRIRDAACKRAFEAALAQHGWTDFEIRDRGGNLVAIHRRCEFVFEGKREKEIRWARPDGGAGLPAGLTPADLPFFGSERLQKYPGQARTVVIVEGVAPAADLDRRIRPDFVTLGTVTGASGTHSPDVCRSLVGWRVILWPDNDAAGREHMRALAARLRAVGVQTIELVGPTGLRGSGDDCRDFAAMDPASAQVRLLELLKSAKPSSDDAGT